ncbi:hypothetical protein RF11_10931 [Thelohanellus kitauei]|uniref:Uncharacterized protein n=1 Tax=Thelohanellus kitauei TaxID=669202 RepID=A0A0C2J3J8_THEKT|nr:hypothetical protein RF11_11656 [Thelohanellus kitauei]KII63607.1 hypothetical protein RF11_10931 [Thelohanellus kitauei]
MCREICVLKLFEFFMNTDFLLGGGRSHSRGRRAKDVWIFGDIQRETPEVPSRALMFPVSNLTLETLFSIIQKWIKLGIPHARFRYHDISDGWSGYLGLDQMGFLHLILNHTQTFVDPTTEAHTNTIEKIGCMPDPICLLWE